MTNQQQAEFDRMRGYYLSQGEKYSFAELWPRAMKARLQLLDALEGVSEEQASFKPGPNDWSIREVALHVVNGSRSNRRLVIALSSGESGDSSNIDPPKRTTEATVDGLRAQLRDDGIDWTAAIPTLPERPPLEPTARHSMFGQLHARAWYLFQRTHDIDHASQIDANKKAAGYPGAKVQP